MKPLDSELKCLTELYSRLCAELSRAGESGNAADPSAAVEVTIRNGDLFADIEHMNSRLIELAREWEATHQNLTLSEKEQTRRLAGEALREALHLARLGEERLASIEDYRVRLRLQLGEINRGLKFLNIIKPLKANFPKFIDSQG